MKSVSLKDLKRNLSQWAEEASKGATVQVTKHNRPYIKISPFHDPSVFYGAEHGKKDLKPCLKGPATRGRYLQYLLEDRKDRF